MSLIASLLQTPHTFAQVKSLFAEAGTEITNQLGVDFPTLALAALE